MTTEGYVQVAPDSSGKLISTTEVTRSDASVVEVQDVVAKAEVNDTPSSLIAGDLAPLSLTPEGRLRVSAVAADVTQVWQNTFSSPWSKDNPWAMGGLYV